MSTDDYRTAHEGLTAWCAEARRVMAEATLGPWTALDSQSLDGFIADFTGLEDPYADMGLLGVVEEALAGKVGR